MAKSRETAAEVTTPPAEETIPKPAKKRKLRSSAWRAMTRIEDILTDLAPAEANRVLNFVRAMPDFEVKPCPNPTQIG